MVTGTCVFHEYLLNEWLKKVYSIKHLGHQNNCDPYFAVASNPFTNHPPNQPTTSHKNPTPNLLRPYHLESLFRTSCCKNHETKPGLIGM